MSTLYNARYYAPTLGRFVSADSIVPGAGSLTLSQHDAVARGAWGKPGCGPVKPQDLNRYSYALNNPVRNTDPTGHVNADGRDGEKAAGDCMGGGGGKLPISRIFFKEAGKEIANKAAKGALGVAKSALMSDTVTNGLGNAAAQVIASLPKALAGNHGAYRADVGRAFRSGAAGGKATSMTKSELLGIVSAGANSVLGGDGFDQALGEELGNAVLPLRIARAGDSPLRKAAVVASGVLTGELARAVVEEYKTLSRDPYHYIPLLEPIIKISRNHFRQQSIGEFVSNPTYTGHGCKLPRATAGSLCDMFGISRFALIEKERTTKDDNPGALWCF